MAIISLFLLATLLCRPALCGETDDMSHAAYSGDLEKVKVLLKANPDLVFSHRTTGDTPLHRAALNNQKAVAEFLLAHGADLNARNLIGQTPLLEAVMQNHKEMVELLLAKNADVNTKEIQGATPLHYVVSAPTWQDAATEKEILVLLLAHGADINAKDNEGNTALHYAELHNQYDMAELLRHKRLTIICNYIAFIGICVMVMLGFFYYRSKSGRKLQGGHE